VDPASVAPGMQLNAKTRKKLQAQKAMQMRKAFMRTKIEDSDSWESCSEDDSEEE